MNRRMCSQSILLTLPLAQTCLSAPLSPNAPVVALATRYIDADHPNVRAAVEAAVGNAVSPVQRAIRIHDFVRDHVRFGWASSFYDQAASEVLRSKIGYCNTKSTLFVAMLRAAGIPARQYFVDIHASILSPFISPGTKYVDHSFTEVLLDGKWYAVDSYIVDKPLFLAAKNKLEMESRPLGYGVHADGVCEWDGRSDAFAQFVKGGRYAQLSTSDYGVFADVGAFYEAGKGVNRLNALLKLGFGFLARGANQRIEAFRSAA